MTTERRMFLLKIGAAGVVGLFLLDRMVIGPLASSWHDQSDRIAALSAKVERGNGLLSREDSIRTHWADMVRANLPQGSGRCGERGCRSVSRWESGQPHLFHKLEPAMADP